MLQFLMVSLLSPVCSCPTLTSSLHSILFPDNLVASASRETLERRAECTVRERIRRQKLTKLCVPHCRCKRRGNEGSDLGAETRRGGSGSGDSKTGSGIERSQDRVVFS
ncbi:hypothetical protein BKA81DRAFT_204598 [Phyllosticta paracitricarpa]|uniref:Secreted protein n=1 Tax=Phyllosticta paracitricarpa TaxID=2016321 RepID=A0ABR1MSA4_9PEZI